MKFNTFNCRRVVRLKSRAVSPCSLTHIMGGDFFSGRVNQGKVITQPKVRVIAQDCDNSTFSLGFFG